MTTEDDFQRALNTRPDDWQTRLVFADWLQDRGDLRAEGYRALGVLKLHPKQYSFVSLCYFGHASNVADSTENEEWKRLPDDWFALLPSTETPADWGVNWRAFQTRVGAEDAAALAFTRLSAARRAELLAPLTSS